MFSCMCKFVFMNDISIGVLLLTLKFLQILNLLRRTLSTYIYILYIYDFFQINHESRFNPVKHDRKQTIQVSSFA